MSRLTDLLIKQQEAITQEEFEEIGHLIYKEQDDVEEEILGIICDSHYYNKLDDYEVGEDDLTIDWLFGRVSISMKEIDIKLIKQLEEEIGMKWLGARWSNYFKSKIVVDFLIE